MSRKTKNTDIKINCEGDEIGHVYQRNSVMGFYRARLEHIFPSIHMFLASLLKNSIINILGVLHIEPAETGPLFDEFSRGFFALSFTQRTQSLWRLFKKIEQIHETNFQLLRLRKILK